jgi:hypothetical protein
MEGDERLSVARLKRRANPLREDVWGVGRLTLAEIAQAVRLLRADPTCRDGSKPRRGGLKPPSRQWHINRVAWLVVRGWKDAISVDVGVPFMGCWPSWIVDDGNHRLVAAIYRGDETILASCSGERHEIDKLRVPGGARSPGWTPKHSS